MQSPPILFDHAAQRKAHARVTSRFTAHDFLWREAALRVEDTLACLTEQPKRILAFGAQHMQVQGANMIHAGDGLRWPVTCVVDEERLPFATQCADAVLSLLQLHAVNDLPGVLAQFHAALRPDGLFTGVLFGGDSFCELRDVLMQVELQHFGGISPRIAPMLELQDASTLLQRTRFALPVADREMLQITYPDLRALLRDWRGMGERILLTQRPRPFSKTMWREAAALYRETYPSLDGGIRMSVEFITLSGWKPSANQQQPIARGSAKASLARALAADRTTH